MTSLPSLIVLILVVASFATFGITLFAVSIYASLADAAEAIPPQRKVIPASPLKSAASRISERSAA